MLPQDELEKSSGEKYVWAALLVVADVNLTGKSNSKNGWIVLLFKLMCACFDRFFLFWPYAKVSSVSCFHR